MMPALVSWFLFGLLSIVLWDDQRVFAQSQRFEDAVWKTGDWNACEGIGCGLVGIQMRLVICEDVLQKIQTVRNRCAKQLEPVDFQRCFIICDEHKHLFQWNASLWQRCQPSDSDKVLVGNCVDGIAGKQHRSVKCVSVSNSSLVVEDEVCEQFFGTITTTQQCNVPCPLNCVTSVFGSWSECSSTCDNGTQIRTRHVLRSPAHGGKGCPQLFDIRPCYNIPSCDGKFGLKFGNWSSCVEAKLRWQRGGSGVTQDMIGARTQEVSCISPSGDSNQESFILTETCVRTIHCGVTPWSDWERCSASCGGNGTQIRYRSVSSLPQGMGASLCPDLVDRRQCEVTLEGIEPCFRYRWLAGEWSTCVPFLASTCGGGWRSREVYCVRVMPQDLSRSTHHTFTPLKLKPVDSIHCQAILKLIDMSGDIDSCDDVIACSCVNADVRARMRELLQIECPKDWSECDLPCKHKCKLSQWSEWSRCALPLCPGDPGFKALVEAQWKGFKRRVRRVLYSIGGHEDCPHLIEVIPCANASCYFWYVDGMTSCRPHDDVCGAGSIFQRLSCRDMWGEVLDERRCSMLPPPPRVLNCTLPCSRECVLSDWGQWSPCPQTCKHGKKRSGVQIRKRRILAFPGPGSTACPPSDALYDSRSCNEHKCSVYYWSVQRWTRCVSNATYDDQAAGRLSLNWSNHVDIMTYSRSLECREGTQKRKVVCKKRKGGLFGARVCLAWSKPASNRACQPSCNRHCILSEWSEWSSCEMKCSVGARSGVQHRRRYVIQNQSGTGHPCMQKKEESRVCEDGHGCRLYRWSIGEWSPCVIAARVHAVNGRTCRGVTTRVVSCYTSTSQEITTLDRCMENLTPIPHASKLCNVKCGLHLAFSEWRQRFGCKLSYPPGRRETPDILVPIQQNFVSKQVGPWSSCFVDVNDLKDDDPHCSVPDEMIREGPTSPPHGGQCGIGRRKRALQCVGRETGLVYNASFCQFRTFAWEECEIPCPRDCEMSNWSQWGQCGNVSMEASLECGGSTRLAHRYKINGPSNGGRACPKLDGPAQITRVEACHNKCKSFFWSSDSNWETCELLNGSRQCGRGVVVRSVACYQPHPGFTNTGRVVKEGCKLDSMPYGSDSCVLPCVDQCVLSDWSSWSPCEDKRDREENCENSTRHRTRTILRQPAPDSDCVTDNLLVEKEKCRLNVNCFTYRCRSHGVIMKDPVVQPCFVTCSIDCMLSDWSIWSSCFGDCGRSRVRMRSREVIRENGGLGRPCSAGLVQKKACCSLPCYKWQLDEWGQCKVPHGVCGEGEQERSVVCTQAGGTVVHPSLCRMFSSSGWDKFAPSLLTRACYLTCMGACKPADWSAWSDCHGDGNSNEGLMTRSRFFYIPGQIQSRDCTSCEVEEVSCSDAILYSYSWKVGYIDGKQEVWCERDQDNTRVSAGCSLNHEPSQVLLPLLCAQDCGALQGALCGRDGWCECALNKGQYGEDGYLLTCNVVEVPVDGDVATTSASVTAANVIVSIPDIRNHTDQNTWSIFHLVNEDGSLKPWTYGAIIGLVVLFIFIISVIYLVLTACTKTGCKRRGRRHRPSSGGNMDMMVTSVGGCSVYGTGGDGPPPYYMNAPKASGCLGTGGLHLTASTSSSYPDRYDDNFN